MKPNIKKYNPDEKYIRGLLKKSGYSQNGFAKEYGISERMIAYYLDPKSHYKISYPLQFLLESLSLKKNKNNPSFDPGIQTEWGIDTIINNSCK